MNYALLVHLISAANLILFLLPKGFRRELFTSIHRVVIASFFHLLAVISWSFITVNTSYLVAAETFAVICELISGVIAVSTVVQRNDRTDISHALGVPISSKALAVLLLPTIAGVGLTLLIPHCGLLDLAYSYAIMLLYEQLCKAHEQELTTKENSLRQAQMVLLAEQMQPLFIFNVLGSIGSLCNIDPKLASRAIRNFAGYLRGNLEAMQTEGLIPFDTELKHIRQYVALELVDPSRMFHIDYDLQVTDFDIPPLTVQPLIENAVRHGALQHKDGTGNVKLRTEEIGPLIRISVEDNGGWDNDPVNKTHRSVGMSNVERRLTMQCGGTLHITKETNMTRVVATIPKCKKEKK